MDSKRRVLYVEDEKDLGNVVSQYLQLFGFDITWVCNASEALTNFKTMKSFDIILIDVQLPDYNGFKLAEEINALSPGQSFIFLTARREKKDRLQGLNIGADDYITKPFDVDELVLRIKNILRRRDFNAERSEDRLVVSNIVKIGDVEINADLHKMYVSGKTAIDLTLRETQLILYLVENEGKLVKREEILLQIWGENDYFMGRSLDVFISRLRKIMKNSTQLSIETVYGMGFILKIS
ncbi:response regulator transcription factor [Sphingobacterium sp. LRF_L2]|uniref:response regulator transcription factor n=1 Tax=Sphingobacterium sp. LRF_L2 TaxID=3369421 RepID=UPI003F5EB4D0